MKKIEPDLLMSALGQALETMAFITIDRIVEMRPGETFVHVSIPFFGAVSGQLTLCAPPALGRVIAANVGAVELDAVPADAAMDALRELANVTVGVVLREICSTDEMPEMAIPRISTQPARFGPHSYCIAMVSAEGHPVTTSFRIDS